MSLLKGRSMLTFYADFEVTWDKGSHSSQFLALLPPTRIWKRPAKLTWAVVDAAYKDVNERCVKVWSIAQ